MTSSDLVELEATIKRLPGVLGCVILAGSGGAPVEIQAFTRAGTDRLAVERSILNHVSHLGLAEQLKEIFVFELDASHFGDRESLARAAEFAEQEARSRGPAGVVAPDVSPVPPSAEVAAASSARPPLIKVTLSSTNWKSEAAVALGGDNAEVIGEATGERTPHGLKVLAQATLDAVTRIVAGPSFSLVGASLVGAFGREVVLVFVEVDGSETVGAALVREGPTSEAAVRATLDAVNRRLLKS
jgi:hypothetical protein